MTTIKNFLLSHVRPEQLKSFGLRLLIGALIADAIFIIEPLPGIWGKVATAFCAALLPLAVWLEGIGAHAVEAAQQMPRWQLVKDNEDSLIKRLTPFVGTKFDVACSGEEDRDARYLLSMLEPILSKAGWKHIDWQWEVTWNIDPHDIFKMRHVSDGFLYGRLIVPNVVIETWTGGESGLAADALAGALSEIGIATSRQDADLTNANTDAVHILIGRKE